MNDNTTPSGRERAVLAGGCFWCLEAVFKELEGVDTVESGYTGGAVADPTYEAVCTGQTGHAEVVRVTFDPARIRYEDLLDVFFATHDPTTLNRQGADVGTQYRSAIFTLSRAQEEAAEHAIEQVNESGEFADPAVTEVVEAGPFYRAEAYHDDYFAKNPNQGYCRVIISPKVAKFRKQFSERLRT
ncbi:MAG: peptide-methionine (S)-S-oxide reductase MsrA [Dehalococcoidia bacterium]|nr:peptide-methionine (S)-S-oxide reductase MsrA [Dehalococcoidia bacterium]